jgi:hypothetical protein
MLHKGTPTAGQAAFEAHRSISKPDRQLTQFLVDQHFPGQHKEFEIDVCALMLARPELTYKEWKNSFPSWRQLGLYYPLALASVYMPTIGYWLPVETYEAPVALSFNACLHALRVPGADHAAVLSRLAVDWEADTTGAADVLSGKLDRLAILMGVKSNGGPFDLAQALAKFTGEFPALELGSQKQEMHRSNYSAWHRLREAVEATFPPSLLSAPLVRPKRDTWGYTRLTLTVDGKGPTPTVRFAQTSLQHIKPENIAPGTAHTYQPSFVKDCKLHQTSQRLQDALWRLGEIATSPNVCVCMLRPDVALATVDAPLSTVQLSSQIANELTVSAVLDKMSGGNKHDTPKDAQAMLLCYIAYTEALDASIPQPVTHFLPQEQAALFWRLDTPSRAIIYVGSGSDVDPTAKSTHHLEKIMVNCKVPHRPTGGILRVPCKSSEVAVRDALRAFARDGLSTHPANTVLLTHSDGDHRRVTPVTCTTLAESVACFALTEPTSVDSCYVGASNSWREDTIDPRYAEKQKADNGFRYRDWTAMHVGMGGTQQSRLAAHMVQYDCLHTNVIPWFSDSGQTKLVQVSSTLMLEPRTLQGRSLRQAVEARFMHDLRMLPTEEQGRISKGDCEIYTDPSGSLGIVYCQEGSQQLHFVCFECKD